ncbi:MAG TPA: DUF4091 domain-containing protein [Syntrophobacteraceae bacterium]|nr:DUF4091 domain-containing protein [Syntrophobacteraceae bacterium]
MRRLVGVGVAAMGLSLAMACSVLAEIVARPLEEKPRIQSSAPPWSTEAKPRPLVLVQGEAEGMILAVRTSDPELALLFSQEFGQGLRLRVYEVRTLNLPGTGGFGDPLVPAAPGAKVRASSGLIHLYVKIEASRGAAPARGEVALRLRGAKEEKEFRVPYEVLPFVLDPAAIPFVQATIRPLFDTYPRKVAAEERQQIFKNMTALLVRDYAVRSFAGLGGSGKTDLTLDKGRDTFARYLEMVRFCLDDLGVEKMRIPAGQFFTKRKSLADVYRPVSEEAIMASLAQHRKNMQAIAENPRWKGKLSMRLWDEPKPSQYPEVVLLYKAARKVFPEFSLELTEQPDDALLDIADVYIVNPRWFDEKQVSRAQRKGSQVWIYCNKASGIDEPLKGMRIIGWLIWRYRLDGYLFFSMNYWDEDPWKQSSRMYRGTFLYPEHQGQNVYPSLRLEMFREGMEDAAILKQVESLAEKSRDTATQKMLEDFRRTYVMKEKHGGSQDPVGPREALMKRIGEASGTWGGRP